METVQLCFWGPRLVPAVVLSQHFRRARMRTERKFMKRAAQGPGWRWVFMAAAVPPAQFKLFHFVSHQNQTTWKKASWPWIEWSQQTRLTLVVGLSDLASKNTGCHGTYSYWKIFIVYLKFKFNSLFYLVAPPGDERTGSVLWLYRSAADQTLG